jgi:hypothetical protein
MDRCERVLLVCLAESGYNHGLLLLCDAPVLPC